MHVALSREEAGEKHAVRVTMACLSKELRTVEEEDLHVLQHLLHQQRSRGAQLETDLAHARKEAATRKEVLEERTTLLRDEATWQRREGNSNPDPNPNANPNPNPDPTPNPTPSQARG